MLEFTVNKLMIEVSSLANPCSEKIVTKVVTLSGEEGVLEAETLSTQIMICESSQGISRVWNSLGHAVLRFLYAHNPIQQALNLGFSFAKKAQPGFPVLPSRVVEGRMAADILAYQQGSWYVIQQQIHDVKVRLRRPASIMDGSSPVVIPDIHIDTALHNHELNYAHVTSSARHVYQRLAKAVTSVH
jgi:hypothetical protein